MTEPGKIESMEAISCNNSTTLVTHVRLTMSFSLYPGGSVSSLSPQRGATAEVMLG